MRVLKYKDEAVKLLEVPESCEFAVGFVSWIHDHDLAGFTAWAGTPGNIEGPHWMHRNGHAWWFELESDLLRFLTHRPMRNPSSFRKVEQVLDSDRFPHAVELSSRYAYPDIHRLIEEDWEDFLYEIREDWIANHSAGRVVKPVRFKNGASLRVIRYEFEDPRDAFAFKMRWL